MAVTAKLDRAALKNVVDKLQRVATPLTSSDSKELGNEVVAEMRDMISKGISPIKSVGRFPAYKDPKNGYPSTVRSQYPSKRNTPVNLFLSGKFLQDLKATVTKSGKVFGIEIGYRTNKEAEKEKGHREGVNTQPKRPTIPAKGEVFAQRIQDIILKVANKAVSRIIKD